MKEQLTSFIVFKTYVFLILLRIIHKFRIFCSQVFLCQFSISTIVYYVHLPS